MIIEIVRYDFSEEFLCPSYKIGVVSAANGYVSRGIFGYYKVTDEQLFFLAVIKHRIEFRVISKK